MTASAVVPGGSVRAVGAAVDVAFVALPSCVVFAVVTVVLEVGVVVSLAFVAVGETKHRTNAGEHPKLTPRWASYEEPDVRDVADRPIASGWT